MLGNDFDGDNTESYTTTIANPGATTTISIEVIITGNNNAGNGGDCWERLVVDNVLVTGTDTTAPVTPTIADETFECSGTPTTPTTTDSCDTSTITGTTTTTFPITTLGTTVVTWTFEDASGNTTTANQNVIITPCVADLSLTKSVDKAIVKIGDTIIYTLTLRNSGPEDAFGVQVTDILPSGLSYNAANSTIPTGTTYNTVANVWDLSNITVLNGQSYILQIVAEVTSAGIINNISEVTQNNQNDPDSTPNSGN